MRKAQKQEILDFISNFYQAHREIKEALNYRRIPQAQKMLSECQEFAISLGENIERLEGEGHATISVIEEYCETLFHAFEDLENNRADEKRISKNLNRQLIRIENSVKNDIKVRKEVVFFPYKVSMWDSLESIYLAAREDPDCDAYCVPVPYYDLNPDHSFGQMHYEGYEYPYDIDIVDWQKYDFEERRPDAIYTHCPYDDWNLVTSIHPRYYTENLKKYTDCLVYVPYYSTAGGMSEAQRLCSAYIHVDYIVIQSPKFRDYFDERIPDQKFLPFGSPKFDRIIRKCQNPPEPPREWREKMERREGDRGIRKKVYFYNTSLNGMLADTEAFLKKMQYVFSCFENRTDVCLLWRPHPLMESTFDSMRPQFRPIFDALKRQYIEKDFGIYDTTSDMTDSIALSDAYIGDAATSVISLFGITGKPIFSLNNQIHSEPKEDSWQGQVYPGFNYWEQDRFAITQGNKLYVSEAYQYDYRYRCDLSKYAYGGYYSCAYEIDGKIYVCPANAQDILVVGKKGVERRIELEKRIGNQGGAFCGAWKYEKYLLLLPLKYPALIRYNTESGEIVYLEKHIDTFVKLDEENQTIVGGSWIENGILYIASPKDPYVCQFDIETGRSVVRKLPVANSRGCIGITGHEGWLWMLPYEGYTVYKWKPDTDEIREYDLTVDGFQCVRPVYNYVCDRYPFGGWTFCKKDFYLTPCWGNMYLKLDTETGNVSCWQLPYEEGEGTGYYYTTGKSSFWGYWADENGDVRIFSWPSRKLYKINLESNAYEELEVRFDVDELKRHETGFYEDSQWFQYSCPENAFNSIRDFLDDNITGNPFNRDRQLAAHEDVASNLDGSCGRKIHEFVMNCGL